MFLQIALLVGQMWLGEITRKRPHKTTFDEFLKSNAPSEIRPIPYIAGTVEVTPSRIWYGDFTQRAVERDSHWTDYLWAGLSAALLDTITVGYRYYCGECFALCYGPDRHVEAVRLDDRTVFQATVPTDNAGGGFLIDAPQEWGGDQPPGEGGQYSWCDVTHGNYTDHANAYLEALLSTPPSKTPSLRGVTALISQGRSGFTESGFFAAGGVGFVPKFHEWKVTVRGQPNNLATGFHKIGRHANPMEVYYEHTTSLEFGAGVPVSEINIPSWQVAAQTFHEEGLGWSGRIENPTSPLAVCKDIEAQCDLIMEPSPSLGLTARLIRRDYSFGSLRILNQDNVTDVRRFSPGTYDDTVSKVSVRFEDQNNNFAPRPAIYIDPANQVIQGGRLAPQTQDYIGVGDAAIANMLATRDGRALAIPRAPLECDVLPSFGRLTYRGEVVIFEWTSPTLRRIMRVLAVTPSTAASSDYSLVLIEDQFATGLRTFGEPSGTLHTDPAVGLDTAPPTATWNDVEFPPDGLVETQVVSHGEFVQVIEGGIVFGAYAPGGQYARIYVTEPGGVQTLSPMHLAPNDNLEATFQWPAGGTGTYQFCIETYSLHNVTNGVKVCASIAIADIGSPSVSPSASVSPSTSPSVSPSASVSPSSSASPSISGSVSPSGSASPSVSPSASISPSASVSPSSSASPSPAPPSRIYFPSTGAAAVSPAFDAAWNNTASATRLRAEHGTPGSSTLTAFSVFTDAGTSNNYLLTIQYVSDPIDGDQTIMGDIKGQVGCSGSSGGWLALVIRVVSNDGSTVRGTLLAISSSQTAASPPKYTGNSVQINRQFKDVSDDTTITLSSVGALNGDRLVIEVGTLETVNAGDVARQKFGENGVSGDLPEDETTTATNFRPWIEFSNGIAFQ